MSPLSWLSAAALCVTSVSAFIALLKEKREKRGKRWRRNALFALTVIGFVVGLALVFRADREAAQSERRHGTEREADKQQIAGLTQSVETQINNNETQYTRYLAEIHRLQDELADLKKQVATEELRKKMDALQAKLDKALTPVPTAKLTFTFWKTGTQDEVVTSTYAPVEGNVATINISMANESDVNAKQGEFWLRLCSDCKYHAEPAGFEHIAGAPDYERVCKFTDLPAGSRLGRMTIEIEVPAGYSNIIVGTKYRCENCEIAKDWQQGTVSLGRVPFPRH